MPSQHHQNLVDHLLSRYIHSPTKPTGLIALAGGRSSDRKELSKWSLYLAQYRLFACHAYPCFIGHMVASIPFSSLHAAGSTEEELNQRTAELLAFDLERITSETRLTMQTAFRYGFDIGRYRPRKETKDLTAEMIRIGASGRLSDGLVLIWTLGKIIEDAWSGVIMELENTGRDVPEPLNTLYDAWITHKYLKYIDDITELISKFDIRQGSEAWRSAEEVHNRVVELTDSFWPLDGDELRYLDSDEEY